MDEIDGRIAAAALETIAMERPMLRDRFAMAALSGIMADPNVNLATQKSYEVIAEQSYGLADAMLKARCKNSEVEQLKGEISDLECDVTFWKEKAENLEVIANDLAKQLSSSGGPPVVDVPSAASAGAAL